MEHDERGLAAPAALGVRRLRLGPRRSSSPGSASPPTGSGSPRWPPASSASACSARAGAAWGRMLLDWLPFQARAARLRLQPRLRLAVLRRADGRPRLPDARTCTTTSACRSRSTRRSTSTSGSPACSAMRHDTHPVAADPPAPRPGGRHGHPVVRDPGQPRLLLALPRHAGHGRGDVDPRPARSSGCWMSMVVTLAVAGLATYVLLPTAPPWLASYAGRPRRPARAAADLRGLRAGRPAAWSGRPSPSASTWSTRWPRCRRCTSPSRRWRPASGGHAYAGPGGRCSRSTPLAMCFSPGLRRRALRARRARRRGVRAGDPGGRCAGPPAGRGRTKSVSRDPATESADLVTGSRDRR